MKPPQQQILSTVQATFDGHGVTFYVWRGRPCVIAVALGDVLGYADGGRKLVDRIRDDWPEDFIAGEDYDVLSGDDLRAFKRVAFDGGPIAPGGRRLTPESGVSRARHLMLLYESGVDAVCLKTEKPEGRRLRLYLRREVLPKLRRGEAVLPGAEPAPVFAPATPAAAALSGAHEESAPGYRMAALEGLRGVTLEELRMAVLAIVRPLEARLVALEAGAGSVKEEAPRDLYAAGEEAAIQRVEAVIWRDLCREAKRRLGEDVDEEALDAAVRRVAIVARSLVDQSFQAENTALGLLTAAREEAERRDPPIPMPASDYGRRVYAAARAAGVLDAPRMEHVFRYLAATCDEGGVVEGYVNEIAAAVRAPENSPTTRKVLEALAEAGWLSWESSGRRSRFVIKAAVKAV